MRFRIYGAQLTSGATPRPYAPTAELDLIQGIGGTSTYGGNPQFVDHAVVLNKDASITLDQTVSTDQPFAVSALIHMSGIPARSPSAMFLKTGSVTFGINAEGVQVTADSRTYFTGAVIPPSTWVHLLVAVSPTGVRVFLNGGLQAAQVPVPIPAGAASVVIAPTSTLVMQMALFAVYQMPVTQATALHLERDMTYKCEELGIVRG